MAILSEYKAGDAFLLWRKGTDLHRALFHFSSPEWREEFNFLYRQKENEFGRRIKCADAIANEARILRGPVADAPLQGGVKDSIVEQQKNEIIQSISNGTLIALGYSLPRRPIDTPQVLPDDVWSGKIDWNESSVTANSLHFVSVHLVHKDLKFERKKLLPVGQKLSKRTYQVAVLEAFNYLKNKGLIDLAKPMTHSYDPIRNYLIATYPDQADHYKNMHNKTIWLVISDLFPKKKSEKITKKSSKKHSKSQTKKKYYHL